MKKNEILKAIISEQEDIIKDLEKAIKVYKNASDLDEDDTLDPEDLSHQTEYKEMQLRLENKLKKKEMVIAKLFKFMDKKVSVITNGALIETDKMYIFLGIVAHSVIVNNKKAIGVSLKAPIVATLSNKQVGDDIQIGNSLHKIISIS